MYVTIGVLVIIIGGPPLVESEVLDPSLDLWCRFSVMVYYGYKTGVRSRSFVRLY